MMEWLVIAGLLVATYITFFMFDRKPPKWSWPASQVLREHNAIPEEHRLDYDLEAYLKELDAAFGIYNVNEAYMTSGFDGNRFSMQAIHNPSNKYYIYKRLWNELSQIQVAMENFEKKMRDRRIEPVVDAGEELLERIRERRQVINEITDEI